MLLNRPALVEMHCSIDDLEWTPSRRYNVPLAVHLPEYHAGNLLDPAARSEASRRQVQDLYARAITRAAEWGEHFQGKPKIVFHPGGMSVNPFGASEADDARAQLDKTIESMVAVAGDGAEVLIENVPRHCWFFGGEWLGNLGADPAQIVAICEAHKIGMTLDLCHLYLAAQALKFDMTKAILHAKPHVRHIHYSGAKGIDGEGLAVDAEDNTFDLAAAVRPLLDLHAVAVPEVWFGHEDGGAAFVRAWETLERQLEMAYT